MAVARPLIAIVGRPNVGKSRLFNRLTGKRHAIVEDTPGVTRDRQYGDGEWEGKAFSVVDTGGFDPDSEDVLLKQMREQAQLALEEADIIFFVTDGREGMTPVDQEIGRQLRNTEKLLYPIVNKIDGPRHEDLVYEFYAMGFERFFPVSAEHGYLIDELMDDVCDFLPTLDAVKRKDMDGGPMAIAVIGKPNAGKSSLINKMLGAQRLLISDVPGTTRDAIDTLLTYDGKEYLLIDTAGVRRRKSISALMEKFSVVKAFKAIDRADVVLFVIDATIGLTEQDKRLIQMTAGKGRPHILLINKWDLVEKDTGTAGIWVKALHESLNFTAYAPIIFISALTGQRVHRIYEKVAEVHEQWGKRVTTGPLNRWLQGIIVRHSPPVYKNRKLKFYFASQVAVRPPTFLISTNYPDAIPASYERYIMSRLREDFDFSGTPIKMFFRLGDRKTRRVPEGK